jgi:hypothetical protein
VDQNGVATFSRRADFISQKQQHQNNALTPQESARNSREPWGALEAQQFYLSRAQIYPQVLLPPMIERLKNQSSSRRNSIGPKDEEKLRCIVEKKSSDVFGGVPLKITKNMCTKSEKSERSNCSNEPKIVGQRNEGGVAYRNVNVNVNVNANANTIANTNTNANPQKGKDRGCRCK